MKISITQSPKEPSFTLRILSYLLALAGYIFYTYNFIVIDYVRPYLLQQMTLDNTALLYTSESIGAIIGSFAMAWLSTRIGIKKSIIIVTLINGLGSLLNAYVTGFVPWLIMRFIIGLALGGYFVGAIGVVIALIDLKYRGRLSALYECCFSLSLILLGFIGSLVTKQTWTLIVKFGAIPPIIIAILMWIIMPNNKKDPPTIDHNVISENPIQTKLLSNKNYRRYVIFALLCIVLSGCNLFAYQFFAAYLTTYSSQTLHLSSVKMSHIVTAQGIGSLIGGLSWGVISDTWGRKTPLVGFILASVAIALFFALSSYYLLMLILVGIYGFMISCTYCWGVFFAELFPPKLRMLGASFYHGGRILSFFAPFVLITMVNHLGLPLSMEIGSMSFLILGALIWFLLPETLHKKVTLTINPQLTTHKKGNMTHD
ncbi:MFS transporter [Cysteiniphilum halobium]|uniref:MFS transporter n=1 Tax=Cysteiniphilum halobium TaxID=2219059 RepID=UPI003F87E817